MLMPKEFTPYTPISTLVHPVMRSITGPVFYTDKVNSERFIKVYNVSGQ
jgi:hypothetical protein